MGYNRPMDTFTKEQRSHCMAQIKSKWTSCEKKLHNYLKGNHIKHVMHPQMNSNPDILISKKKLIIFVHGCFWHKCPKCYREPSSNRKYWVNKVQGNAKRDKKAIKFYKNNGYKTLTLWEHEVKKNIDNAVAKIKSLL